MSGIYQTRIEATGRGIGDVRLFLERVGSGGGYGYGYDSPCPTIAAEYTNRHPLNPGGLTYFRLVKAKVDYVNRVFVPCELCIQAFAPPIPGLIGWIDFTTNNQTEFISGDTFTWGAWSSTGGKFGGFRYLPSGSMTVMPQLPDRPGNDDPFPAQTTFAMWLSNKSATGTVFSTDIFAEAAAVFESGGGFVTGDGFSISRNAASGGSLRLVSGDGASYNQSNGSWPSGEWVSVIVTHDGINNQIKAWINGNLAHEVNAATISTHIYLWAFQLGSISTIYVYDYIFSDADRAAFDSMTSPIPTS